MYKQVKDIRKPICCALGRIAGDRCVWECDRGAERLCNLIAIQASSRLIKTDRRRQMVAAEDERLSVDKNTIRCG